MAERYVVFIKVLLIIAARYSIILFEPAVLPWEQGKAALVGELAVPSACNPLQQG